MRRRWRRRCTCNTGIKMRDVEEVEEEVYL